MLFKSTKIHPLVTYIKKWESFNSVERKRFYFFMIKGAGGCLLLLLLVIYLTMW